MKAMRAIAFLFLLSAPGWAFRTGADPKNTGATGDQTCAQCHGGGTSTAAVQISVSGGNTYTPGEKKTITVNFSGTSTRYGFQITARLASNAQAGDFTSPSVTSTAAICDGAGATKPAGQPCANNALQFVGHTTPSTTGTWAIEWTAPAAAAGDIKFFAAGNAANGDGQPSGDRISTTSVTITAATGGGGNTPAITDGGVVTAFSPRTGVVSGGWIEIYGTNLSTTTKEWAGTDFSGNNAPTSLDGVSVSINNQPAFVRFISPGQINVQAPSDTATGPVEVVVTNANGRSPARNVQKSAVLPTVLAPFSANNRTYIYAALQDGALAGTVGLVQGATFRPARAGDTLVMYGVGFGAARAAGSTTDIPAGTIVTQQNTLVNPVTIRIGSVQVPAANILYQGLGPNFIGLYQFNVTLPANVASGDQAITFETSGSNTGQTMFLTIQ